MTLLKNVFGAETDSILVSVLMFNTIQSFLLATCGLLVSQKLHDRIAYGLLERSVTVGKKPRP